MKFSEYSRVWIYQADREFNPAEAEQLHAILQQFTSTWTAHNNALLAGYELHHNRFIVLVVDESQAGASGCSIDKSVNVMKAIEQQFGVNLFDRFNTAYVLDGQVLSASREQMEELIAEGKITAHTPVFNNLVSTYGALHTQWLVPYKDSWHARVFGELV